MNHDCSCPYTQDNPPYNKGAFWIEISFPCEYPFKPPTIRFRTKIYHPNVDEKGEFCLPIISAENWQPSTRIDQGMTWAGWIELGLPDGFYSIATLCTFFCFKEVSLLIFSAAIQALIELLNNPEIDFPRRPEVATEFRQDHEKFLLQAEDHTCNFSEKRPCEWPVLTDWSPPYIIF